MRPFTYARALDEASAIAAVAANPRAAYVAGGTDLLNLMREGQRTDVDLLVDIGRLPLRGIDVRDDGSVRIGALEQGTGAHPVVRERFPLLREALLAGASQQVRNMATPGGNLLQRTRCPYFRNADFACNLREPGSGCPALGGESRWHAILGGNESCVAVHPSDLAVALLAVDAVVHTRGPAGERAIPLDDFYLLPGQVAGRENALEHGELIVAVELPNRPFARRSHYLKVRDRASFAFALVSAAVALDVQDGVVRDARVALGGVAPKPWRSREAEAALIGARVGDDAFRAAGEAAVRDARPLRDNGFKVELAKRTLVRTLARVGGTA